MAILVEMDGVKVIHFGDATTDASVYTSLGLVQERIDMALIPMWFLVEGDGEEIVRKHVAAGSTVAMHLQPQRNARLEEFVEDQWPDVKLMARF